MLRDPTASLEDTTILNLLQQVSLRLRWMPVEMLEEWDGQPACARAPNED